MDRFIREGVVRRREHDGDQEGCGRGVFFFLFF